MVLGRLVVELDLVELCVEVFVLVGVELDFVEVCVVDTELD